MTKTQTTTLATNQQNLIPNPPENKTKKPKKRSTLTTPEPKRSPNINNKTKTHHKPTTPKSTHRTQNTQPNHPTT
jgi:hypothetical protein